MERELAQDNPRCKRGIRFIPRVHSSGQGYALIVFVVDEDILLKDVADFAEVPVAVHPVEDFTFRDEDLPLCRSDQKVRFDVADHRTDEVLESVVD